MLISERKLKIPISRVISSMISSMTVAWNVTQIIHLVVTEDWINKINTLIPIKDKTALTIDVDSTRHCYNSKNLLCRTTFNNKRRGLLKLPKSLIQVNTWTNNIRHLNSNSSIVFQTTTTLMSNKIFICNKIAHTVSPSQLKEPAYHVNSITLSLIV